MFQVFSMQILPSVIFLSWAKAAHGKDFAMCPEKGSWQSWLCRPRLIMSLLPCVTHSKAFSVCIRSFAVCMWHIANPRYLVVRFTSMQELLPLFLFTSRIRFFSKSNLVNFDQIYRKIIIFTISIFFY